MKVFTILPGTPTIVTFEGTSFKIIALAPIFTLFPITIFPRILAPEPIKTLLPTVGWRLPFSFFTYISCNQEMIMHIKFI